MTDAVSPRGICMNRDSGSVVTPVFTCFAAVLTLVRPVRSFAKTTFWDLVVVCIATAAVHCGFLGMNWLLSTFAQLEVR
jgi:hypothetical protein